MDKFYFLLSQGFLACVAPFLVMIQARVDHHAAAMLSIALSIVGFVFSVSYFGQKSYIAVNGNRLISYEIAGGFRSWSLLFASCASLVLCYFSKLALLIPMLVILIKMSESIIDFWSGVMLHEHSAGYAGKKFFSITLTRSVVLSIPLLLLGGLTQYPSTIALIFLSVILLTFLFCSRSISDYIQVHHFNLFSFKLLFNAAQRMFPFVLATMFFALLMSMPRWLLLWRPQSHYHDVDAIALSIVPVIALTFQAIWLSNLRKLSQSFKKGVKLIVTQVIAGIILLLLTYPAWSFAIRWIYGFKDSDLIHHFETIIAASIFFFASAALQNIYKVLQPIIESISYILGIAFLLFSMIVLKNSVATSLLLSAIGMILSLLFWGGIWKKVR